ncbi:MAG: GDP-mannose 4,6-dehydratase [Candidatus Curtissbacteria bacterium]|nr:GDP-mannose 4,6-dehydratase [Candidatus Curtissbacteria bacterium]
MASKILVTGCAGFIGSNLTDRLLDEGYEVIGVDNFNDYYDPRIKEGNISKVLASTNFKLYREDILNFPKVSDIFKKEKPDKIVHLAARAGVRPSIADPLFYTKVNVDGTLNLLKLASDFGVKMFIFGSSSSVYGNSPKIPFKEDDLCQNIISPYGATKRAAEFFAESFHQNFGLKVVCLRFFTVYGERGRPDMAPTLFTNAILEDQPISRFGDGGSMRDYTYVGDIVDGILKALESGLGFEIINLGNSNPINLSSFIAKIEKITGKKANIKSVETRVGDAQKTWANIEKAKKLLGWQPQTDLDEGLERYIKWLQKN